eukprot:8602450-Pyramimonas_sp.AAC.1
MFWLAGVLGLLLQCPGSREKARVVNVHWWYVGLGTGSRWCSSFLSSQKVGAVRDRSGSLVVGVGVGSVIRWSRDPDPGPALGMRLFLAPSVALRVEGGSNDGD